ncbi:endonuclease III domain-containing protein [Desulfothermobacter acidiphilus]|uniref:endonuclease III domain-containing protein n=1 Tax=Desulfothermobacter acidiphilus TaxID=1938353 RepID=UPI003F8ADA96
MGTPKSINCRLTEAEILAGLRSLPVDPRAFVAYWVYLSTRDPFAVLVATLLSQHSTDRKALEVYRQLQRRLGSLSPSALLRLSSQELAELLRPGGLHRRKAELLLALARLWPEVEWEKLGFLPLVEARRYLSRLPGVGSKTADVLLLHLGYPTFPVDTHIARITTRLLWPVRLNYGAIQRFWMELLDPEHYQEAHLRLIQWGREICRPQKPRCVSCWALRCCNFAKMAAATPVGKGK